MIRRFILPLLVVAGVLFATIVSTLLYNERLVSPASSSAHTQSPKLQSEVPEIQAVVAVSAEEEVAPTPTHQELLLDSINPERAKHNLPALALSAELNQSAHLKSEDMRQNNYFAHKNFDGRQGYEYMDDVGQHCRRKAEVLFDNTIWSDTILEGAVRGWMNSRPHREIILSTDYSIIGFGLSQRYITGHLC